MMSAMVRKEFAQLRRDRRTVAMLVVMPLLLLIVFGYAARFDVSSARTIVIGPDAEPIAERLPDVFNVVETRSDGDRGTAVELLRGNRYDAAVLGDSGTLLLDGTRIFATQVVLREGAGRAPPPDGQVPSPSAFQPAAVEVLFNPELDTPTIMIPALIGLIMLFVGALATSMGVVRERQDGTLEQLAVMPLRAIDVFAGKLAPYLAIAITDLLVVLAVGVAVFDVPFVGSPLLLATGALVFLFVALSLGVLISTVSQTQGQAVQLALMLLLPQVMLSGLLFPVEAMAEPLQVIALVLPLTWFVELSRGVMVKGAAVGDVGLALGVLAGMAVVVASLATLRFRAELSPAGDR